MTVYVELSFARDFQQEIDILYYIFISFGSVTYSLFIRNSFHCLCVGISEREYRVALFVVPKAEFVGVANWRTRRVLYNLYFCFNYARGYEKFFLNAFIRQ